VKLDTVESDEQQILKLFEDGDRALIAADVAELSRIFADDYIQYDESGKPSAKQDVISNLRSGKIRYISMTSTGRLVRLLGENVAIVHGSEDDEVEQGGKRLNVHYVYVDAVVKRNGRWQIVGSQLARPEYSDLRGELSVPTRLTHSGAHDQSEARRRNLGVKNKHKPEPL
jgi:Domain of unknown function (DUF4440)